VSPERRRLTADEPDTRSLEQACSHQEAVDDGEEDAAGEAGDRLAEREVGRNPDDAGRVARDDEEGDVGTLFVVGDTGAPPGGGVEGRRDIGPVKRRCREQRLDLDEHREVNRDRRVDVGEEHDGERHVAQTEYGQPLQDTLHETRNQKMNL
jgi:hypothetical protein